MWISLMTLKYRQGHRQSHHVKAVVWHVGLCKMFGRQWTNEAKIAIFNDHTLIWRNDATSPGNPREYLHKPLYCQKLRSLGYIFVADSIWVALQILEQFCPKAVDATPLVAESEKDVNAKWPFKVIQGHLFWYHWRAAKGLHIAQYNKYCLRCEGSEDTASERSENRHFLTPHSHLTPLSSEPPRISA